MKRFLLFAYSDGHALGGVNDLVCDFDRLADARTVTDTRAAAGEVYDHVEALDTETGRRISFDSSPPCTPFSLAGRRAESMNLTDLFRGAGGAPSAESAEPRVISAADVIAAMSFPPGWTWSPLDTQVPRTTVTPAIIEVMAGGSVDGTIAVSPAMAAHIAQGLARFAGQHVHDVRHDRAGFGERPRLTCYDEACGGATLVTQPYMTQDVWNAKVAEFMAEHLCLVVKNADHDGPTMTYDPAANTFTAR